MVILNFHQVNSFSHSFLKILFFIISFIIFFLEPKDKLHAEAHQVMKLEIKDGFEEGMVIETLRPGMASNDQKVILRFACYFL